MRLHEVPADPYDGRRGGEGVDRHGTAYRIEKDSRLPSQRKVPRQRRRPIRSPDNFDAEIVPLLWAAPGIRPVAIFEETLRRHPELGNAIRQRRVRSRRAVRWRGTGSHLPANARAGRLGLSDFTDHEQHRPHHRRTAARSPSLSFAARLFRLAAVMAGVDALVFPKTDSAEWVLEIANAVSELERERNLPPGGPVLAQIGSEQFTSPTIARFILRIHSRKMNHGRSPRASACFNILLGRAGFKSLFLVLRLK
ncbi:hypothetical protein EN876_23835 [Mesorhizobium sp. M2D.F.Ca.ET.233.01.1.1]|nr:hypothetical protein EN876_23835 [Mesorhizobium sp. M2D.F.Ca.ET.233.01.1.1]TGV65012.1 hypothetical protein EN803_32975 [Mesorhizobium sp. M2D.F.Ca.ET.160.01.1.1]